MGEQTGTKKLFSGIQSSGYNMITAWSCGSKIYQMELVYHSEGKSSVQGSLFRYCVVLCAEIRRRKCSIVHLWSVFVLYIDYLNSFIALENWFYLFGECLFERPLKRDDTSQAIYPEIIHFWLNMPVYSLWQIIYMQKHKPILTYKNTNKPR